MTMPDEKDRQEIFRVHLRNKPLEKGIDPAKLATSTEGLSGAEIAAVCNRAALSAVRRGVNSLKRNPDKEITLLVKQSDIQESLAELGGD
jgi:transitional endoplasmic reticulum ATPase